MFLLSDRAIKNYCNLSQSHQGQKRNACFQSALACEFHFVASDGAKDGSRFVIPLSERKMIGFY